MTIKQETILLFHMDQEKKKIIRQICFQMGIRVKEISAEEEKAPLGMLAEAEDWMNPLLAGSMPEGGIVEEEMLVFAGLADETLDMFLSRLRHYQARVSLKAVLTPYNALWNAGALQNELRKERAGLQMKQNK